MTASDLTALESETLLERLRVQGTLGQGGTSTVFVAEQTSLGRRVAVKTLRDDACDDPAAARDLLREARILGALEHPNIVPVHDAYQDDSGRPHLLLKHIEGAAWSELMYRPELVKARFGVSDTLEWNLGVLIQVCHAIAFAHERGVIHRDLKPANVMIGAFGEVVVLDWGSAVRLDELDEPAAAASLADMRCTPAYMAPEMLSGGQMRVSRATDVYMLGAILYEILTGQVPHRGRSLREIFGSVLMSQPPLPPEASPELAQLVRQAMAPYPSDRMPSVLALQRELSSYLKQRAIRAARSGVLSWPPRAHTASSAALALAWLTFPFAVAHDGRSLLVAACNAATTLCAARLWYRARARRGER